MFIQNFSPRIRNEIYGNDSTCHLDAGGIFALCCNDSCRERSILTMHHWKTFYVYILTNELKTVFYTGMTNNLEERIIEHYQQRG